MQAFIFSLLIPILPLYLSKFYSQDEKSKNGFKLFFRYTVYTLVITSVSTVCMVFLCEKNSSFLAKIDTDPGFAIKYLMLELFSALLVFLADWQYKTRTLRFSIDIKSFQNLKVYKFLQKGLPWGIYLLAAATVVMNFSLMFDNVLWGDEAYSANLVRSNIRDILEIMYYQKESHPPLYYFWLRMLTQLLGLNGWVLHLSSLLCYLAGVILTLVLVQKRYGKIPASFLIAITGLSIVCVEYNLEVRMYAMAFLGVAFCYYCAGQIIHKNRPGSWIGMVSWGLIAAYSHYYALLSVVILMIIACLMTIKRFGRKNWIKTIVAGLTFILCYLPWINYMFSALQHDNSWLKTPSALRECLTLIFGGARMQKLLLPILLFLMVLFVIKESHFIVFRREEKHWYLKIQAPSFSAWSADLYILTLGLSTIFSVIIIAYLVSALFKPLLTTRYLYPLLSITAMMIVICLSHFLGTLQEIGSMIRKSWLLKAGKALLLMFLAAVLFVGVKDFRDYRAEAKFEASKTDEILALIGEETENMTLVNYGVKHIGWTVLEYYYPHAQIINGLWNEIQEDDFWYFTTDFLSQEDVDILYSNGYTIAGYGEKQLGKYPLVLYHFYKE